MKNTPTMLYGQFNLVTAAKIIIKNSFLAKVMHFVSHTFEKS